MAAAILNFCVNVVSKYLNNPFSRFPMLRNMGIETNLLSLTQVQNIKCLYKINTYRCIVIFAQRSSWLSYVATFEVGKLCANNNVLDANKPCATDENILIACGLWNKYYIQRHSIFENKTRSGWWKCALWRHMWWGTFDEVPRYIETTKFNVRTDGPM